MRARGNAVGWIPGAAVRLAPLTISQPRDFKDWGELELAE